ncbi:MAG: hypothetical protein ABR549_09020 [Mycobacteriales bacterium]
MTRTVLPAAPRPGRVATALVGLTAACLPGGYGLYELAYVSQVQDDPYGVGTLTALFGLTLSAVLLIVLGVQAVVQRRTNQQADRSWPLLLIVAGVAVVSPLLGTYQGRAHVRKQADLCTSGAGDIVRCEDLPTAPTAPPASHRKP